MGSEAPSANTGLTFDAEKHEYRIDGKIVPSVTQVLSSAGLIDDTWFNESACTRGTYVAQATQFYDEDTLDYDALDEGLKPYVMAWERFLNENNAEIEAVEQRVCRHHGTYAGTLDRIIIMRGWRWVLDIKTGSKAAWHGLQTAGYADCLEGLFRRACIILRDDATYKFYEHEDAQDFHFFRSALSLYQWKSEKGLLK